MNRQPYCRPPRRWEPKLTPWWVRLTRWYRRRQLARQQRIVAVEAENLDALRSVVDRNQGVLIAPNHSAHYDAPALYLAADQIDLPLSFMTAWQVFAMSSRWECWAMQRLGCFSVDREGNDRQAFKQAALILEKSPHPLVIFPEGDIYHTTDVVTPFREGAAAIALTAAKRAERPVVVIPCGIKFWYLDPPTRELDAALLRIEQRLYLRSDPHLPLTDRIHRLAEAALALKELDYLRHTRAGRLRDRVVFLTEAVLAGLERRHGIESARGTVPQRVKILRQKLIRQFEDAEDQPAVDAATLKHASADMDDLFFVMQLFSYRGDYLVGQPTIERIAETVDKFEEDILGQDYPTVRGRRRVVVRFGEPVEVRRDGPRAGVPELTALLQQRVQQLVDVLAR